MHEYSMIQALLERVQAEAGRRHATAVHRLDVDIGELAGVDPRLFATAFETFRAGTLCAGAELRVTSIPARWRCPGCGEAPARGALLRCTACDLPARLEAGDEIILSSIEMEVPTHVS